MKIAIDARMYGGFGIGRYTRNLITHLQKIDQENEYYILHTLEDFKNFEYSKNFHKVLANFHWYGITEQAKLPGLLKKIKLDLVHFPHFNIPVFYQGRFVVTIHDLIHQHFQMERATTHGALVYSIKKRAYNLAFNQALKKSQKIIAPSEYVKDCLEKEWNVSANKIVVTEEAVEEKIIELEKTMTDKKISEVLSKFNIKPPFIFYVGTAHPHKNVEGLIKAFLLLRQKYQYLTLVLSGQDNYFWQRVQNELSGKKDIVFTGFVSDEELVALYKSTSVYVVPSFEEGFGIPILEAMACKTPVASSDKASLKEVGGDACVYFNPEDTSDMAEKISNVLNDQKLRTGLIKKGEKRYKDFSWEKLAKETLSVYKNIR